MIIILKDASGVVAVAVDVTIVIIILLHYNCCNYYY